MNFIYPDWSDGLRKSVLYYQRQVKDNIREQLRNYRYEFLLSCGSGFNNYSMESVGINVFHTLFLNSIPFEYYPINYITFVCLLCSNIEVKKIKVLQKSLFLENQKKGEIIKVIYFFVQQTYFL